MVILLVAVIQGPACVQPRPPPQDNCEGCVVFSCLFGSPSVQGPSPLQRPPGRGLQALSFRPFPKHCTQTPLPSQEGVLLPSPTPAVQPRIREGGGWGVVLEATAVETLHSLLVILFINNLSLLLISSAWGRGTQFLPHSAPPESELLSCAAS